LVFFLSVGHSTGVFLILPIIDRIDSPTAIIFARLYSDIGIDDLHRARAPPSVVVASA
jgi:hypothetical protein